MLKQLFYASVHAGSPRTTATSQTEELLGAGHIPIAQGCVTPRNTCSATQNQTVTAEMSRVGCASGAAAKTLQTAQLQGQKNLQFYKVKGEKP